MDRANTLNRANLETLFNGLRSRETDFLYTFVHTFRQLDIKLPPCNLCRLHEEKIAPHKLQKMLSYENNSRKITDFMNIVKLCFIPA